MKKSKIICVVGATASGKTSLSVEIAKAVNGEIISADSMQVYKNMPIATAAVTEEEKQGIPHYLVEFLDPSEIFSVADFVKLANERIKDIISRGKVPIVVGGTGLFVDSLVKGINFSNISANDDIRKELEKLDNATLYSKLQELDYEASSNIHPNNRKRIIRALELCYGGITKTEQNENSLPAESPYDALYIGIGYNDRQNLYDRINLRVDLMKNAGLVEEAQRMNNLGGLTSRQAIGHKELIPYFNGDISLELAIENIKMQTRRYAKRQLTWFRRNENINWLYADTMSKNELNEKAIDLTKEFLEY